MRERSAALQVTPAILRRAIAASVIGDLLEWFDFAVYGYMVPFIAPHFFPDQDKVAATLATFAVFALGYFARPVGAVVLGRLGDRIGRRPLLVLSIAILGFSSCGIGLLPTYATIGVWAPVLLVALRLAQGFSVGAEYTGSMVYATEIAPAGRRGFYSSFATLGTMLGILLSSGAVWLTSQLFCHEDIVRFAWRLPFILGFVIALFGLWLRRHIPETLAMDHPSETPVVREDVSRVVKRHLGDLVRIIGVVTGANVALYLVFVFAVDAAAQSGQGLPAQAINTIALCVMLPFILLGGYWSDRSGRKKVSLWSNGAILLLGPSSLALCLASRLWPQGPLLDPPLAFLVGQLLMAVPIGLVYGVQGAMVAELLPKEVRCLVFSVAYSLAMALFAGSAPMFAQWMIQIKGWSQGPLWYMTLWIVLALICVQLSRETSRDQAI